MSYLFGEDLANLDNLVSIKLDNLNSTCTPTIVIAAITTPLVVFLFLYFLNPKFIQKKKKRDWMLLIVWTFLFSAIVWGVMWGHTFVLSSNPGLTCRISM